MQGVLQEHGPRHAKDGALDGVRESGGGEQARLAAGATTRADASPPRHRGKDSSPHDEARSL